MKNTIRKHSDAFKAEVVLAIRERKTLAALLMSGHSSIQS